jgi:hypothetical protein
MSDWKSLRSIPTIEVRRTFLQLYELVKKFEECPLRSSPSPAAPAPDWVKGYPPEMRAWAEACNIGAEEQYIREQRSEASAQGREDVLEELESWCRKEGDNADEQGDYVVQSIFCNVVSKIDSMRSTQSTGEAQR